MKIEIELEEIEALKKDIERLEFDNRNLMTQLEYLDEKELIDKAMRLSQELTIKCLGKIFEKLGFENHTNMSDLPYRFNLRDGYGKYWWNSDNIEVEISATITNKMRSAFIRVGIVPVEYNSGDEN